MGAHKQEHRRYVAPPTLAQFHGDDSFVRGVMGPIGSGKSTSMCYDIFLRASRQPRGRDGLRRTRWAVVRNSYRELRDTTIKTWLQQFPEDRFGGFAWTDMSHRVRSGDTDIEVIFRALDRPEDVKKLLSLELSGAWINEAREVPKEILDGLTGRVGRYPSVEQGGCAWSGIIMDTNPPDDDHWWYRLAEEERPEGWRFWSQPPALVRGEHEWLPNLAAENIDNLPDGYGYYYRQIPGKTEEWIKVYVLGEYGTVQAGRPVYPEYNDALHCSRDNLTPYDNLPLLLGFDFGLTPACVFAQLSPRGQLRIIDELVSESMGIRQFARDVVRPHIAAHYASYQLRPVGDPAGTGRAQTDESTCMDELAAAGLPTIPARSNAFLARREAVAGFLTRMTDGQPGFLLSPKCRTLRRGFLGGYHYRRLQVSGERYTDVPDKNQFSHCLAGDTLIRTPDGDRPISALRVGDYVDTPLGPRTIQATMSRYSQHHVIVDLDNNKSILCTVDHPFILDGKKVEAGDALPGMACATKWSMEGLIWAVRESILSSNSTVSCIIRNLPAITHATINSLAPLKGIYTELFGLMLTGLSRSVMPCITRTTTRITIRLKTFCCCRQGGTHPFTALSGLSLIQKQLIDTWTVSAKRRPSGMGLRRAAAGIAFMGKRPGKGVSQQQESVSSAEGNTKRIFQNAVSALCLASKKLGRGLALMTRRGLAAFVGMSSSSTNTAKPERVVRIARVKKLVGSKPVRVYDLTVDDTHCFYAEGVLVGNCHDALQYLALEAEGAGGADEVGRRRTAQKPARVNWR